MKEWKKVKLGEICERLSSGKNIKASLINEKGLYPVYGGNGVRGYTSNSNFEGECVIIGRQGAYCGNIKFFKGKGYMTEHAVVVCANSKHNTYFLGCALSLMNLERLSHQSAQPGLSVKVLADQTLLVPSKQTQDKIASILSRYDALIENYQKQIKLLEEAAARLYKQWFVELKFPGYQNTTIIDGVPEGWEKKTLDSFCNVFTGKKNANQGITNGKYKFFTCGDTPLLINSYIYDGPAIIISGNGSYTGRTTFYKGKFDLYQRTYACTMKDMQDEILIYGLFEIVRCELTNKISGGTHGAAIPYIVMSDVTKFDFLYEENVMRSFSSIMHKFLSTSLNLSNQIRHLTESRDRLLPKLMSGELEV